ncbi:MAG: hypothetical protein AAF628_18975 [Planctomycetota bacterium]
MARVSSPLRLLSTEGFLLQSWVVTIATLVVVVVLGVVAQSMF